MRRLIFTVHLGDMTVICKTEICIVPDNEVLVDRDAHDPAGVDQLLGDEFVFPGWPGLP